MPSAPHAYLHGHHDSVLASHRWRTPENSAGYLLPHLPAGAQVLDVGCGPGTITVGLAARAAQGRVIGIDAAPDVLDVARRTAADLGQSNVSFGVGDAYHLAFDDGVFDVVHAHLRALAGEPDAGRRMLSWARAAGFAEIESSASSWCFATPEDRSWWGGLWAERITESAIADRAVEHGLATRPDLQRLAQAWRRWAASEDGWFLIPHGEILCHG